MTKFEEEFTKDNKKLVNEAKEKLGPEWDEFMSDVTNILQEVVHDDRDRSNCET